MRKSIERAKELDIQFDYETSIRMAHLFDLGEALIVERARFEEIGLPTQVYDWLKTITVELFFKRQPLPNLFRRVKMHIKGSHFHSSISLTSGSDLGMKICGRDWNDFETNGLLFSDR